MSTAIHTRPSTPAQVLAAAQTLRPTLAERAAEIENARRLPADLVAELTDAGILAILLPRAHGGTQADLPEALAVFETLARGDASTGWTAMIGACGWGELTALPEPVFAEMADGGRGSTAGAFKPGAQIAPVDGGYRVTGRWSHASGCTHAPWLWGNCVQEQTPQGPRLRIAVFPAAQARIEDTWRVSGLCGTGSHHFAVQDLFVPADHTFVPLQDPPRVEAALGRVPTPALFAIGIAAVAVGIASGALDDLAATARTRVPMFASASLCTDLGYQRALAEADADLRAARGLLEQTAAAMWARAATGSQPDEAGHARDRAAAAWVVQRCVQIVDVAYGFGGSSAIFADNPLQRRWRDVQALRQHFLVAPATFAAAGSVLAGQGVPVPVF